MKRKKQEDLDDNGFAAWGGYMAAKVAKLNEQFKESTNNIINKQSDIFKGVAIYVNGLTNPSAYELKELMSLHGGTYHSYQISRKTTHVIASNLPNVKIKNLGSTPIIKPTWITESIDAKKLLDYKKYILYTNESKTQPRLQFNTADIDTQNEKQGEVKNSVTKRRREKSLSPDLFNETSPEPAVNISNNKIPKTAIDPGFLTEFYTNSRLHHIATLGATFKQLITQWREQNKKYFPGREKLHQLNVIVGAVESKQEVVMHIDMDCFFVSVGLRNKPELKGHPVAVTHAKASNSSVTRVGVDREAEIKLVHERSAKKGIFMEKTSKLEGIDSNSSMSEIASCSYEARRAGVRNGMFLGSALKLCPNLRTIPYDFEGYKEIANILYETIASYTLDIEAVSCDEMFVDVGPLLRETNVNIDQWATHIRNEIFIKTGCTCSTGFGSNRLQARLATRKAKPDGYFYLKPDDVEEYMKEVYLKDLPGVGYSTVAKLKSLNLQTCGDVQSFPLSTLKSELGNGNGETLYNQCHGEDKRSLCFEHERKSVSAEVNYGIRFTNIEETKTFLKNLSEELENRLNEIKMQARTITLKVMVRAKEAPVETAKFLGHGVCDNLSRSSSVSTPITNVETIYKEACSLFDKLKINPVDLRGIGLQLSRLEKIKQINNVFNKYFIKPSFKEENVWTNTDDCNSEKYTCTTVKGVTCIIANDNEQIKGSGRGRSRNVSWAKRVAVRNEKEMLTNFFKAVGSSSTREIQNKITFMQQNIDMAVLAELPDDIRDEIIKDYKLNEKPKEEIKIISQEPIHSSSSGTNIAQLKTSNQAEQSEVQLKSIFSDVSYDELKQMLKGWIQNEKAPRQFDVDMLGEHFKQMALDRKIEDLSKLVNFFYRYINKTVNCEWHEAYINVTNHLQEGMLTQYESTLFIRQKVSCPQH